MEQLDTYARSFDEDVPTPDRTDTACPECGGTVTTSDLETLCVDCGLVIDENPIDRGPEWRGFEDDSPGRTPARLEALLRGQENLTRVGADSLVALDAPELRV